MKFSSLYTFILVFLLGIGFQISSTVILEGKEIPFILSTGPVESAWEGQKEYEESRRIIEFNPEILQYGEISVGDKIIISVPGDEVYTVDVKRVHEYVNGANTVSGRIEGYMFGSFYLSHHEGIVLGSIEVLDYHKMYQFMYDTRVDQHILKEVDRHLLGDLPCEGPLTQEIEGSDDIIRDHKRNTTIESGHTIIDVMIVYTPAAANWASGMYFKKIENAVALAMERTAMAILNSDIEDLEFRLVYSDMVDYSGDAQGAGCGTMLSQCNNGSGAFSVVPQWRNQWGADLVSLFAFTEGCGGVAWLLGNPSGNPNNFCSVTRVQQSHFGETKLHEFGHTSGQHHAACQSFQPGTGGMVFDYSVGWLFTDSLGINRATVMAYHPGYNGIPYVSNPAVSVHGEQTGSYLGSPNALCDPPSDNARTWDEMKDVIANYRQSTGLPVQVVLESPLTGEVIEFDESDESDELEVELRWYDLPSSEGVINYQLDIATDEDFTNIVFTDNTLQDTSYLFDDIDGTETYYWRARAENNEDWGPYSVTWSFSIILVGTGDEMAMPDEFRLSQNYPNPFNPSTVIRYGLPERSVVRLEVYNVLGQRVATLVDTEMNAGYHEVVWHSEGASSGIYFYRMDAVSADNPSDSFVQVRSMLFLK